MKKLVSLLLTLLMIFTTTVLAETALPVAAGLIEEPCSASQDFYVDVLIHIDQPDDSILEIPLRFKAITLTCHYNIIRDAATGRLAGFNYDPATFITLSECAFEQKEKPNLNQFLLDHMDLQFGTVTLPESFQLHQSATSDYVWLEFSGKFEVTYWDKLFFGSHNGELIDTYGTTLTYEYTFSNEDG